MGKTILISGLILGALAVMLGAFGAHALKSYLVEASRYDTYQTAVDYHFYHALALLGFGILISKNGNRNLIHASYFLITGVLLFSGSLYMLCFTDLSFIVYLTPLGGLLLIAGWLYGAYAIYRN